LAVVKQREKYLKAYVLKVYEVSVDLFFNVLISKLQLKAKDSITMKTFTFK
jgi:hypothetical protein